MLRPWRCSTRLIRRTCCSRTKSGNGNGTQTSVRLAMARLSAPTTASTSPRSSFDAASPGSKLYTSVITAPRSAAFSARSSRSTVSRSPSTITAYPVLTECVICTPLCRCPRPESPAQHKDIGGYRQKSVRESGPYGAGGGSTKAVASSRLEAA